MNERNIVERGGNLCHINLQTSRYIFAVSSTAVDFGSGQKQRDFPDIRVIVVVKMAAYGSRFVVIDEAFGRGSDESAQYGLQLFAQLNLQLLIVTPLQKIHIIEPFVAGVGFVHNEDGRNSVLRNLSIEEYRADKQRIQG